MTKRFPGNHPVALAVANMAGSAGKTTTVVTLASLIAQQGGRVLVIDLDGQTNATTWLGAEEATLTSGHVMLKQASAQEVIVDTKFDGISLMPATDMLFTIDQQMAATPAVGKELRLRTALRKVRHDFDVILMDCPGSMNTATLSALLAADHVLSVVQPTIKELEGVPKIQAVVEDIVDSYGMDLSLGAVIPCNVPPANAGRAYQQALEMLHDALPELATPPVRRSVKLVEAYGAHVPLPEWARKDGATQDYRAVLDWLTEKGIA